MTPRRALLLLLMLLLPGLAAAQGDPSFNLVNRGQVAIAEVYVSPVTEQFWGRNRLGTDQLAPGRSLPVRLPRDAGCRQDVRVVFADGRSEERRELDTCGIVDLAFGGGAPAPQAAPQQPGGRAPQGGSGNPSFHVVNHGTVAIREIYVSSVRDTHWGEDRLGADTLPPGRWLAVRLPVNDCLNDIRVVWMDGRQEERRQVDTCPLVNLVFR